MSIEEIKALALSFGLDPASLKIFEPYFSECHGGYIYRMEYESKDWSFALDPRDSIEATAISVRDFVHWGLAYFTGPE